MVCLLPCIGLASVMMCVAPATRFVLGPRAHSYLLRPSMLFKRVAAERGIKSAVIEAILRFEPSGQRRTGDQNSTAARRIDLKISCIMPLYCRRSQGLATGSNQV
ncbi:hypothetical protein VUR80DRAFT_8284 [Thermomyces stellatus]